MRWIKHRCLLALLLLQVSFCTQLKACPKEDIDCQVYSNLVADDRWVLVGQGNVYLRLTGKTLVFRNLLSLGALFNILIAYDIQVILAWFGIALNPYPQYTASYHLLVSVQKLVDPDHNIVKLMELPGAIGQRLLIQYNRKKMAWEFYPVPLAYSEEVHVRHLSSYARALYRLWEQLRVLGISHLEVIKDFSVDNTWHHTIRSEIYPDISVCISPLEWSLEELLYNNAPANIFLSAVIDRAHIELLTAALACLGNDWCLTETMVDENGNLNFDMPMIDFPKTRMGDVINGGFIHGIPLGENEGWLLRSKGKRKTLLSTADTLFYQSGEISPEQILLKADNPEFAPIHQLEEEFITIPEFISHYIVSQGLSRILPAVEKPSVFDSSYKTGAEAENKLVLFDQSFNEGSRYTPVAPVSVPATSYGATKKNQKVNQPINNQRALSKRQSATASPASSSRSGRVPSAENSEDESNSDEELSDSSDDDSTWKPVKRKGVKRKAGQPVAQKKARLTKKTLSKKRKRRGSSMESQYKKTKTPVETMKWSEWAALHFAEKSLSEPGSGHGNSDDKDSEIVLDKLLLGSQEAESQIIADTVENLSITPLPEPPPQPMAELVAMSMDVEIYKTAIEHIENLGSKLEEQKEKMAALTDRISQAQSDTEKVREEAKRIEQELKNKHDSEVKQKDTEIEALVRSKSTMEDELGERNEELSHAQHELTGRLEEIERLKEAYRQLEEISNSIDDQYKKVVEDLNEKHDVEKKLREDSQDLKAKISAEKRKKTIEQNKVTRLNVKLDQSEQYLLQQEKEFAVIISDLEKKHASTLLENDRILTGHLDEIKRLKETYRQLEATSDSIHNEYNKVVDDLNKKHDVEKKLREDNKSLRTKLSAEKRRNTMVQKDVTQLNTKLNQSEQDLLQQKEEFAVSRNDLEKHHASTLSEKDQMIENLKQKTHDMEAELETEKRQVREISRLRSELDSVSSKNRELDLRLAASEESLERIAGEKNKLNDDVKRLNDDLSCAKQERDGLVSRSQELLDVRLGAYKTSLEQAGRKNEELEDKIKEANDLLEAKKLEYVKLQDQFKFVSDTNKQLGSQYELMAQQLKEKDGKILLLGAKVIINGQQKEIIELQSAKIKEMESETDQLNNQLDILRADLVARDDQKVLIRQQAAKIEETEDKLKDTRSEARQLKAGLARKQKKVQDKGVQVEIGKIERVQKKIIGKAPLDHIRTKPDKNKKELEEYFFRYMSSKGSKGIHDALSHLNRPGAPFRLPDIHGIAFSQKQPVAALVYLWITANSGFSGLKIEHLTWRMTTKVLKTVLFTEDNVDLYKQWLSVFWYFFPDDAELYFRLKMMAELGHSLPVPGRMQDKNTFTLKEVTRFRTMLSVVSLKNGKLNPREGIDESGVFEESQESD